MDLGSFIQAKLKNFQNTIAQRVQPVENAIGGAVQNVFQPQIKSPIPQPMSPQASPFQQAAQNVGNFVGQQASNYFQGKNSFGQQMPFNLGNPFAPAPRVNIPQINTGNGIRDFALNIPGQVAQSVLNSPSDIQKAVPQDVKDIQSGQIKNPGTALQDIAKTTLPIANLATLGGGTLAKGVAEDVGKEVGYKALGQAIKQGALSGAKYGGAFGVLQGLASSNQLPQQLLGASQQGIAGAAVGAGTGGLIGGVANRIGAIQNILANNLQQKYGLDPQSANQAVSQFARDELGRFTGIKNDKNAPANIVRQKLGLSQNEPVYYGDLRESLGLPKDGNYQIPVGLSLKTISKAEHDANTLPIKQGAKLPISEPLPWETEGQNNLPPEFDKDLGTTLGNETKQPPQAGQATEVPNMGKVAQQVRLAHFSEGQKITAAAEPLAQQANAVLKGDDNLLFRQAIENPSKIDEYARQASNPQGFAQLAKNYSDFTDQVFKQATDNKVKMNFVNDYLTHIWDLSTPQAQEIYNNLMTSNFKSGFSKQRMYATLQEGLDAGLKLKNPNVSQDIAQYARSMAQQVGQQAAFNKANELVPNSMINMREVGGVPPRDYAGKPYQQSPIPGQDATFVSPDLAKKLNYYNPSALQDNPIVKVLDKVNTGLKETKLAGGLFHAYRESVNFIGASVGRGQVPRLDEAGRAFVDSNFWNNKMMDFVKRGVVSDASNMGITLSKVQDIGKYNQSTLDLVKSNNPLDWLKSATFGRLINYYKLKLVDGLPQNYRTPEVGKQIEALFNGINNEVAGTSKTTSQLGRFAFLAAPFNVGKIVNVGKAAFTPSLTNPAATFARASIIGTVVTTAMGTEILRKLISGNFSPDIKSFVSNSILSPNVTLPYKSPTGQALQLGVPGTDVSDIAGAVNDPSHFITARAGPALSLGNQIVSGKDYYGNPLVNPFSDGGPGAHLKAAGNLALAQAPIPIVQGAKVLQGKENLTTAALNTAGFRVHTDPNSPTNQYFNGLNQTANSLNPNDQKIFLGIIHPTTKDPEGNPVIDKTPLTSPAKYEVLLSNPKVLAAEVAFEKSQPNHDPLWDLPPKQLQAYMQAQVISKNNPTSYLGVNDKTVSTLYSEIPQDFFVKRQAFFNSLQSQGVNSSATPTSPQMPSDVSAWFTQHNALPTAKAKALDWQTPEGQKASAFMTQAANYTNQQRADLGLPLINPSSGTSGSSGYSSAQKSYIKRQLRQVSKPHTRKVKLAKAPAARKTSIKPITVPKLSAIKPSKTKFAKSLKIANPKNKKLGFV